MTGQVNDNAAVGTKLENVATVRASNLDTEFYPAGYTSTSAFTYITDGYADLLLEIDAPTSVEVGSDIVHNLTVTNLGDGGTGTPADAGDISLSYSLGYVPPDRLVIRQASRFLTVTLTLSQTQMSLATASSSSKPTPASPWPKARA